MAVIGLDLGGTKLAAAVFSGAGEILEDETRLLAGRESQGVAHLMTEQIDDLLNRTQSSQIPIEAVGVSVPGIYRSATGSVWAPNIPGWDDYPLLDELQRHVGSDCPVVIDSDRTCYILGEHWQGAAQDCQHAIFLAVGTGIGAGIMVDGRILRGARDIAGAVGWWALSQPYRSDYRGCGDFEYHASGPGLVRVARDLMADNSDYTGPLRHADVDQFTAKDIFQAFRQGDALARQVLQQAIGYWGRAAANLVSLFNPETIIFGGGVFGPATELLDDIRREARKWAQPISIDQVTITASQLGDRAGLYGTGRLAFNALASATASNA